MVMEFGVRAFFLLPQQQQNFSENVENLGSLSTKRVKNIS
jgi:hypothetical protein